MPTVVHNQYQPRSIIIYEQDFDDSVGVDYTEIPQLITDLRRTYNAWKISQEQTPADGVIAAILLQSHVAAAPGDFS